MSDFRMGPGELRFAELIWENEPLSSGSLVQLAQEALGWKKPSTYTTLKKLSDKGLAKNENTVVTSLVPREQVQAYASEHFVEHTFHGSLPGFLAAFLGDKVITEQEAEELKRLIDEHRKE